MIRLLVIFLLVGPSCFAQSGYLGSKNGLELEIHTGPSIRRTNSFKPGETEASRPLRLANLHYRISYSRISSKRMEMMVGYSFTRMSLYTFNNFVAITDTIQSQSGPNDISKPLEWLDDPRVNIHAGHFDLRFYRSGSLSPTGKFYGVGLEIGVANMTNDYNHLIGRRGAEIKSSSFNPKYSVLEDQSVNMGAVSSKYFYLYGVLGRNYPLTKSLLLSVSTTFPLTINFIGKLGNRWGFEIDDEYDPFLPGEDIEGLVQYSIRKYRRITFNVGLKLQI